MSKKEQSNLAAPSPQRFTLPKSHILRGKRNFQRLFSSSTFINSSTMNLRFASFPANNEAFKVGFISPKKIGNAVHRNRSKRLMREAYRLNKHIISDLFLDSDECVHAVFLARHSNLRYHAIEKDMVTLLTDLRSRILSDNSEEL